MIACRIRYGTDPRTSDAVEERARTWGQAIPRRGADLLGHFAPHEGPATAAHGLHTLPSLAAYEAHRARPRDDPAGRANFGFARRGRFVLEEARVFLRLAPAPRAPLVRP